MATDDALDPRDAFDELVLAEPDVCNACFSVIKRDHRRRGAGQRGHDKIAHDPFGEVTVREGGPSTPVIRVESRDLYGEICTYPSRTICGECGELAGRTPSVTLSRRDALERVPRLARCLEDHGLQVSERAMQRVVRHLKGTEEYAGRDVDIFRAAVALGIEHGRGLASGSR